MFRTHARPCRVHPCGSGVSSLLAAPYTRLDETSRLLELIERAGTDSGHRLIDGQGEREYQNATVELCPGDVLLAFTDGVPEGHNPENEEFGEERLQQQPR